jgi:tetratricopeptide (TPR) repeat protein
MRRSIVWIGLALLLSVISAPVSAQSQEDLQRAQQHFAKGAEWFASGEYAKAVVEFTTGHSLAPNAMFLYNVSLCYERLERLEDALGAAERARKFDGMPPEVAVRNDARVHAFHVVLEAQEVANALKSIAAEGGPEGPETGPKTVTRSDGITILGWAGVGLTAVGAAFLIGGVTTNSGILKEIDRYEDAAAIGDAATYSDSRTKIEKKQKQGKLFYGIGAGAAGLGVTLFLVDLLTGTEEVPVATVIPLSDGAMVNARFQF